MKHIRLALTLFALGFAVWAAAPLALGATAVNCGATPVGVAVGAPTNLQIAIASAAPGSTVIVSGSCTGNFTINKNLVLEGQPSSNPVLNGNGSGVVLTIQAQANVLVAGLVITGGTGSGIIHNGGNLNTEASTGFWSLLGRQESQDRTHPITFPGRAVTSMLIFNVSMESHGNRKIRTWAIVSCTTSLHTPLRLPLSVLVGGYERSPS